MGDMCFMKRSPALPPQRGGIEGGEKRSRHALPLKILHAGHPTLDPSPEGREIAAFIVPTPHPITPRPA